MDRLKPTSLLLREGSPVVKTVSKPEEAMKGCLGVSLSLGLALSYRESGSRITGWPV